MPRVNVPATNRTVNRGKKSNKHSSPKSTRGTTSAPGMLGKAPNEPRNEGGGKGQHSKGNMPKEGGHRGMAEDSAGNKGDVATSYWKTGGKGKPFAPSGGV